MQVTFNITRGHVMSTAKIITLGLLLSFGIQFLFAWTAPGPAAPGGNVDGPLTVGAANQTKTGGLNVGALTTAGGASIGTSAGLDDLCLNGTCINAWPTGGASVAYVDAKFAAAAIPSGSTCGADSIYIGWPEIPCKGAIPSPGHCASLPGGWYYSFMYGSNSDNWWYGCVKA